MKIDGGLLTTNPLDAEQQAQALETLGYDGAFTFDGPHDPFLPLLAAARSTRTLRLSTAIAVAFARNPMTVAQLAWDLQLASEGRFTLGLGTQIKAHIERRFSMPWSRPAARMREFVLAVRAIWDNWQHQQALQFDGEFYRHTLMPPLLTPQPLPCALPPILLAGVGPQMTEVAGEVADGFLVHPLNSPETLRQVSLPALARGRQRATSTLTDRAPEICCQIMTATGDSAESLHTATETIRMQLAFYASTPAYRCMLECHGWGELQPELQRLTREGRWDLLPSIIDDTILHSFAVVGEPHTIAEKIQQRLAGLPVSRVSLVTPYSQQPAEFAAIARQIQAQSNR